MSVLCYNCIKLNIECVHITNNIKCYYYTFDYKPIMPPKQKITKVAPTPRPKCPCGYIANMSCIDAKCKTCCANNNCKIHMGSSSSSSSSSSDNTNALVTVNNKNTHVGKSVTTVVPVPKVNDKNN